MGYRGIEGAESVGFGLSELQSPLPDMVCPSIPYHGYNNFWTLSCRTKQQMEEHKVTCYPHCKQKNYKVPRVISNEPGEKYHRPATSIHALETAKQIVRLNKEGFSNEEISIKVCRGIETVRQRLREVGIYSKVYTNSTRKQILAYLHEHPESTTKQVAEVFQCNYQTASTYCRDFRRGLAA